MHELELLLGSEARLARERVLLLLDHDAGVAELLHMVDARHALHHLLGAELLQGFEAEVPKALVPPPSLVIAASSKAEGLRHLRVEDVKVVAPSLHLGE